MLFIILFVKLFVFTYCDEAREELSIKVLSGHRALMQFSYNIIQFNQSAKVNQHYHLFPQVFGEILSRYSIEELHFSLTRGQWDLENWGFADRLAPDGAELWVWFSPDVEKTVSELWKGVTNVLSGHFCSSLSKLSNNAYHSSPLFSYRPEGLLKYGAKGSLSNNLLRVAHEPSEALCTENLTPWWKLLPCKNKAGIGKLLTSIQLWNSIYRGISVDVKKVCHTAICKFSHLQIDIKMTVVLDLNIFEGHNSNALNEVIPLRIVNQCPLVVKSHVVIKNANSRSILQIYDIHASRKDDVKLPLSLQVPLSRSSAVQKTFPFTIRKIVSDFGNEKCNIRLELHNRFSSSIYVVLFDRVPSQFHMLASSFKIDQAEISHYMQEKGSSLNWGKSQFEIFLRLAPNSRTVVKYELRKPLQRWTSFPPDANHGVLLPSAVATITLPSRFIRDVTGNDTNEEWSCVDARRIYSESVLVNLATPDFSMPYNVICLVCTVIAICFGSIHNVTCRTLILHSSTSPSRVQAFLNKIKAVAAVRLNFFKKTPQAPKNDVSS